MDDTIVYDYSYTPACPEQGRRNAVGNRLTYKDEVTQSTTNYTYT